MSTGINNTVRWTLTDGELVIEPVNGVSGVARGGDYSNSLFSFCTGMTEAEYDSVESIVYRNSVAFEHSKSDPRRIIPAHSKDNWVVNGKVNTKITSVDVSGLDTTNVRTFDSVFSGLSALVRIVGLNLLNTLSAKSYNSMFRKTALHEIDISGFKNTDINTTSVLCTFLDNPYLQTITLPTNFNLNQAIETEDIKYKYLFGIAKGTQAKKGAVAVNSDEDFFKLSATTQGGTWVRDISGSAELKFGVNKITRDGNSAEMQYTYYSNSATVEIYLKESGQSSFPLTPSNTFNIEGTGTDTVILSLASDNAYDVMVKVYDGETTLYTYPSIDSNVLLFSVDEDGNAWAKGDIEDGQGNVLADKADSALLAPVATSGDYDDLSNKPALAAVATSGDYDDLTNKPSPPADYVIEEGNSGGWKYRKWNNGTYECWKYNWGSSGAFAGWGSLYYRDIDGPTFPITFTRTPIVNLTPSDSQAYILGMYSVSTTKIGKIRFGHNNTNSVNSVANIYVIGNWK